MGAGSMGVDGAAASPEMRHPKNQQWIKEKFDANSQTWDSKKY